MFDPKSYIESGIIEQYCLGLASEEEAIQLKKLCLQYPEIEKELLDVKTSVYGYLSLFQKSLPPKSRSTIKQRISENQDWENAQLVGNEMQLENYISISRNTDIRKVQDAIKALEPPAHFDNIALHSLYEKDGYELTLVWVKEIVPMEEHPHLDESFLVLEGTAECSIDGEIFYMQAGDFMRIPKESHHEVIITSSTPAKAIQSRVNLLVKNKLTSNTH